MAEITRRWPTAEERRAVTLGADSLVAAAEWQLRDKPRQLRKVRSSYRGFCAWLLAITERDRRKRHAL